MPKVAVKTPPVLRLGPSPSRIIKGTTITGAPNDTIKTPNSTIAASATPEIDVLAASFGSSFQGGQPDSRLKWSSHSLMPSLYTVKAARPDRAAKNH